MPVATSHIGSTHQVACLATCHPLLYWVSMTAVLCAHCSSYCHVSFRVLPWELWHSPQPPPEFIWVSQAHILLQQARQCILDKKESASSLALRLSTAAFHHSVDRSGQTPYSLGASEAFDMVYSGMPFITCHGFQGLFCDDQPAQLLSGKGKLQPQLHM